MDLLQLLSAQMNTIIELTLSGQMKVLYIAEIEFTQVQETLL